jgi:AGCS family alanine or glycine:cation symporter
MVHSASSATEPAKQASLLIFEIFTDTFFVCTMSVLLVLVTGTWTQEMSDLLFVQQALAQHFPHMECFMPFLLSLLGYSVVTTYFSAGMRAVQYLLPTWGRRLYYVYSATAFLTFTFLENRYALSVMSLFGFSLLVLNSIGIWRLRHLLSFDVSPKETAVPEEVVAE